MKNNILLFGLLIVVAGMFSCDKDDSTEPDDNNNIPPMITCPADVTVDCNAIPGVGTAIATATATDNCALVVTVRYDGEVKTGGSCIEGYTLTRTWTAEDNCGNTSSCSQVITVEDNTPPISFVSAEVGGNMYLSDTVQVSNTGRAFTIQGKPFKGFTPGIAITVTPGIGVGVYKTGVNGRIEGGIITDTDGEVYLARAGGEIEILEHILDEYIKGTFSFEASHGGQTLPDKSVTNGEFEVYY